MSNETLCPFCGSEFNWRSCKCDRDSSCPIHNVFIPLNKWKPKIGIVPVDIDHVDEISIKGVEILCWDGCDWHIDYVETCSNTGNHYMANGTSVEAWCKLPTAGDAKTL